MPINYTNWTLPDSNGSNVTSLTSLFKWINNETGYGFGIALILLFFFFCYGAVSSNTTARKAFTTAIFLTAIWSIGLRSLDLISNFVGVSIILLTILCGLWLIMGKDE